MQTEPNAKQKIVERIKKSTNILVTVGKNPSVDELSSALALSLMLNKMDKHTTAVFSGAVPPAINFLEPEKLFENTVNSLRDFIIALDKEKADRLRYKVEDQVVRIFITPYKTVLSEKDLQFSQGDFNVELVVAIGVDKRDDLDTAITAHGRILHDAEVVTINTNDEKADLGSIDWADTSASSYSEMLVSLSEALKAGLLDEQIATALLTGIVSATDRFRNEKTTPRVMTMSAQLMAAGANQQLIAEKLETTSEPILTDDSQLLPEGDVSEKVEKEPPKDGELEIDHADTAEGGAETAEPDTSNETLRSAEEQLSESLSQVESAPKSGISVEDLQSDLARAADESANEAQPREIMPMSPVVEPVESVAESQPMTPPTLSPLPSLPPITPLTPNEPPAIKKLHRTWRTDTSSNETPSFGGTLSATTSTAEEDKRREEEQGVNRQILSHSAPPAEVYNDDEPGVAEETMPVTTEDAIEPQYVHDESPLEQSAVDSQLKYEPSALPIEKPLEEQTLEEIDRNNRGKIAESARNAVDEALNAMPYDPSFQPLESTGAIPGIEIDHNTGQVIQPELPQNPTIVSPQPMELNQPAPTGAPMVTSPLPLPSLPPLPDFSTLPALPGDQLNNQVPPMSSVPAQQFPTAPQVQPQQTAVDPGQFRIPGQ